MDLKETIPKEFNDLLVGGTWTYPMYDSFGMALCLNGEEEIGIPILDDVRIAGIL